MGTQGKDRFNWFGQSNSSKLREYVLIERVRDFTTDSHLSDLWTLYRF